MSSFWNNNDVDYESNGDKNSNLLLDEYLNKIKTYLRDITIDRENTDTCNIQLKIPIDFISLKDTEEEHVMHSTSDNIKFTPSSHANEVVKELFESLLSKYQDDLETSMRGGVLIFDLVQLMYYKCYIVNFIDSPDWIKNKKATINSKNEDDEWVQYTATVA